MHINWKKEIYTIPNLLSLFRLLLIPVYLGIFLNTTSSKDYFLAGSVLAVSCLTDAADGWIARKYHMISNLGKLLDPFADKCTQLALILCLSVRYPVLNPVLILFVLKESFQLFAVVSNLKNGKVLPGALVAGKVCTAVLFISLIYLVLFPNATPLIIDFIAVLNSVFLSISFTSYFFAFYGKKTLLEDFRPE